MKSQPRIRVLVIDDSAFSRRTIIRMLERSPLVEVADWAPDGQEALAKALENEYDLITLDLEMPRMDGFTFLRILMARKPTPVIVVSGRGDNQDVFKALELGAVDFVHKPIDLDHIERVVRKQLTERAPGLRGERARGREDLEGQVVEQSVGRRFRQRE